MHEAAALEGTALVQRLLQSIENEGGVGGSRDPPADDAAGEDVDHESHVDEPGPGRHVGEVADPKCVWARCLELPVDPVERAHCCWIRCRRPDSLSPHDALQSNRLHQPRDGAPGHRDSIPAELPPDLAHALDVEVCLEHALDLDHQRSVAPGPCR